MERTFTVGTFAERTKTGTVKVRAYMRDYHPEWDGCIEYKITGRNSGYAKHQAIALRKLHERKS